MRTARLVGLSPDGRSLIVATDSGEELALAADDRLRAALRGDRPRLGQLEIEMESALSPREIQTRIRSGDSLDDVTRVAGIPMDRVERFAAPVLAEREHVASLAMTSSVRRRGETAGHRALRTVLQERLQGRGVDLDTVHWDSYRLADGRWGITAAYQSGEASRTAEFLFDLPGRFSVAGNDDARWILGEHSPSRGPQPGRRRPVPGEPDGADTEPTLDLSDELALVRAVQDPAPAEPEDEPEADLAVVHTLHSLPDDAEGGAEENTETVEIVVTTDDPEGDDAGGLDTLYEIFEDAPDEEPPAAERAPTSEASDAAAIPPAATPPARHPWEPSIVVNYPVEPGIEDDDSEDDDEPPALADRFDERQEMTEDIDEAALESARDAEEAAVPAPPAKPTRRKRASVPSWDEIMFGGPRK